LKPINNNGCNRWKDIKYLQPLDINNIFNPNKKNYDSYNDSRKKLKLLRDIFTHMRKSIQDFILSVQDMEMRVVNDMSFAELQSLELDYISNMNNMLNNLKNASSRLDDNCIEDIHLNDGNYSNNRHLVDVRMTETYDEKLPGINWIIDSITVNNNTIYFSNGCKEDKFPITRSNEVEVKYSSSNDNEIICNLFYVPGISINVNKYTSQCMLQINEPRHFIGNKKQEGSRVNNDYHKYIYVLGPNVRSFDIDSHACINGNKIYAFLNPTMARSLINNMTGYLYNNFNSAGIVPDSLNSNPRGALLHIDKIIQNILRADRQIVQGDIIRKLPLNEAYASDYHSYARKKNKKN